MTKTTPHDAVNHPSHYTQYPVEVIELTRHMSFNRGNAVKYVARAGFKGGPEKELEDIDKAIWYLKDERNELEKKLKKNAETNTPHEESEDYVVSHPAVLVALSQNNAGTVG